MLSVNVKSADLVVALDFNHPDRAREMIQKLNGLDVIYKIGLELFLSSGPGFVKALTDAGIRVFLDLKFYDIPNTTAAAVIAGARLGAEFMSVHLSGGRRMFDEIEERIKKSRTSGEIKVRPKILGISVLTSFQEEEWVANVSHMAKVSSARSIEESVTHFADFANEHPAIFGMVCSPREIAKVREQHPDQFLMVPGIRPEGVPSNDQARILTPLEAVQAGASAIVVGRPIIESKNPREMAERILKEIK